VRRLYRGNKVFVKVDGQGCPVLDERGLAVLRYKTDDPREYNARPDDVLPITEEALRQLEAAKEARRRRTARIRVAVAGTARPSPGPAGAGIVFEGDGFRREVSVFVGHATHQVAELVAVEEAVGRLKDSRRKVRLVVESAWVEGVLTGTWEAGAHRPVIDRVRALIGRFADLTVRRNRPRTRNDLLDRARRLAERASEERENDESLVRIEEQD
jgi:ribonuclease HI